LDGRIAGKQGSREAGKQGVKTSARRASRVARVALGARTSLNKSLISVSHLFALSHSSFAWCAVVKKQGEM
jgi:hypothetical protein